MMIISDVVSKLKSLKRHITPWVKNPFELIEQYLLPEKEKLSKDFFLYLICYCLSLTGFIYGYIMTQSNILLLLSNVNHRHLSTTIEGVEIGGNEGRSSVGSGGGGGGGGGGGMMMTIHETILTSQFITILYFGEMFGAIISFPFMDNFGRKYTLIFILLFCFFMIIWTMITESFHHLYTSRFFIGISLGFMMTISPIYIAEVATHTQRGQCISFLSFNNILGSIFAITSFHLLSYLELNWKWTFVFPMLLILVQIYVIIFLPDSPRWLLAKKTPSDCSISLQIIRRSPDISREFNILYRALSSDARLGDSWLEIILSRTIRVRLFITILIQIIPQFIGIQMIIFFGYEIMKEMNIQSIFISILCIYFSGLIGTMILFHYIESKGRHYLLSVGNNCIGIIWLLLFCIVLLKIDYLKPTLDTSVDPSTSSSASLQQQNDFTHQFLGFAVKILYIFFLCLFYANYYLSWGSIGWIYNAEIFPYRARAKAVSITTSIHYCSALLASQLLQVVLQADNVSRGNHNMSTVAEDDITTATRILQGSSLRSLAAVVVNSGHFYEITSYFDLQNIAQCFFMLGISCFIVNIVIYLMIPETAGATGNPTNYNSFGTSTPYSGLDGSNLHLHATGEHHLLIEDEDNTIYEPKSLHKYSRDMRESKFSYYHDPTTKPSFFLQDEPVSSSASKHGKEEKFKRTNNDQFSLIPDDNMNTTSTVNTYTDFIIHSDEGSEASDITDNEAAAKSSFLKKLNDPFGSASRINNNALPPAGSSARKYHSNSFSSLPLNSSAQKSTSSLSAIGATLYESLFSSGTKKASKQIYDSGSKGNNHHHAKRNNGGNRHSRNNSDDEFYDNDREEEHFEPLIESFAMKLPFHDK